MRDNYIISAAHLTSRQSLVPNLLGKRCLLVVRSRCVCCVCSAGLEKGLLLSWSERSLLDAREVFLKEVAIERGCHEKTRQGEHETKMMA